MWNEAHKINYVWLLKNNVYFFRCLICGLRFQLHEESDHSKHASCILFVGGQWQLKLFSGQPDTLNCDLGIFPDYRNYY